MDLKLVKDIYNLHIKGFEGLDFNVIRRDDCEITYNTQIKDCFSNFVSDFDAKNIEEFEKIINEVEKIFQELGRKTTVYLNPSMENIYRHKEEFFSKDKFERLALEVWQIYQDWENVSKIETNCEYKVELELAKDMKEYGKMVMMGYQTGDEDDPYGDLDDGYLKAYSDYQKPDNHVTAEFYFVKVNDNIVGTTQSVYDENLYGIYSLAILKDYRGKGIGKEVLKKQLQMCKDKSIKIAYLQTEQGFYPAKMYRKIGFQDLCEVECLKKL